MFSIVRGLLGANASPVSHEDREQFYLAIGQDSLLDPSDGTCIDVDIRKS